MLAAVSMLTFYCFNTINSDLQMHFSFLVTKILQLRSLSCDSQCSTTHNSPSFSPWVWLIWQRVAAQCCRHRSKNRVHNTIIILHCIIHDDVLPSFHIKCCNDKMFYWFCCGQLFNVAAKANAGKLSNKTNRKVRTLFNSWWSLEAITGWLGAGAETVSIRQRKSWKQVLSNNQL